MMKAAFAAWDNRIAPVFDAARQVHLVEAEAGQITHEANEDLPVDQPIEKSLRLAELGVHILVCGAISRTLYEMVSAHGIQVFPFVSGDLREIIKAWISNRLERTIFSMPGCGRHGRYQIWYPRINEQEELMFGMGGGKAGSGGGRGQGRGGQGRGRMGGRLAGGPGGLCVCPQCGEKQPHQRGMPCVEQKCPKCGASMTRE